MSWRSRIVEAIVLLVAVAITARVVLGLLGPIAVPLVVLLILVLLISRVVTGPRSKG